jgi:Zn-dependent membrane protease YugP
MQFFLLLFLIALTGTLWGRSRFLKIYGQESLNHLSSGVTGAEFAEAILKRAGLGGIAIAKGRGVLPDFYDPEQRRISLAPQHFGAATYSALALAALQAGKALQHAAGHRPLLWRVAAVRASGSSRSPSG